MTKICNLMGKSGMRGRYVLDLEARSDVYVAVCNRISHSLLCVADSRLLTPFLSFLAASSSARKGVRFPPSPKEVLQ